MPRAFITGCSGTELTSDERAFFREAKPFGLILFQRNCQTPQQVRALVRAFREAVDWADAPVLIDQEGGRVQRLQPPHWRALPPPDAVGRLYALSEEKGQEGARLLGRILAAELSPLGINVNCMPLLDVPAPGGHEIIGDRAFSTAPDVIINAAQQFISGLVEGGCLPVIKHIPGHGRAGCDSHKALPVVHAPVDALETSDFAPFRALNDTLFAMSAHVVYSAIDAENPATTSPTVVQQIIRRQIGFSGLLMTDDLSMNALEGPMRRRAADAFAAGCDLALHCNGELDEMQDVALEAPELGESGLARYAEDIAACGAHCDDQDMRRYEQLMADLGDTDVGHA